MTIRDVFRRKDHDAIAEVDQLVYSWRAAAEGAGVSRTVITPSGPTVSTARITFVVIGPPVVLTIAMLPGQVASDYVGVVPRIAEAMGFAVGTVHPAGTGYIRITLRPTDPLATGFTWVTSDRLNLGRQDDGQDVLCDVEELGHAIIAGRTGSGKTTLVYGLLSSLAERSRNQRDVIVAGIDPSGLTLRPFEGTIHAEYQCVGLANPARAETVLNLLVEEMDRRVIALPLHLDMVETSSGVPRIVVILEELPALYRALSVDPKAEKRVRALVARLLSESRKAAYTVVIVAQRPEAGIVGSDSRAQAITRVQFSADNAEAVRLLFNVSSDAAERHANAGTGIALVSVPGVPLGRVRAPYITYRDYVSAVRAA